MKVSGLAVLFVAGAFLAGAATADTTTATITEQTTTTETTTEPATTVVTTATVEQTTTRRVIVPTSPTTTATTSSSGETPAWVWVLVAVLGAAALILAGVLLAGRGRGGVSAEERRRRLDGAVGTWAMQGWALESQSADSAVLRRGGELMVVSVDDAGHVSTRPLPSQ